MRQSDQLGPLSQNWMTKWWKCASLYKIKTKPLAKARITAQDIKDVEYWYNGESNGYLQAIQKYSIKKRNCYNFDETGFRVECPRGLEVLVPIDIKEVSYCYCYC